MTRSLFTVLFVGLLVVGLGLVVYKQVFGPQTPFVIEVPPPATTLATTTTPAGPANGSGSVQPVDPGAAVVDSAAVVAVVAPVATLVASRGAVQVRHGDTGEWRDMHDGTRLEADDVVRAGRNAEATLQLGTGVEVKLSPRSELRIRELTDALARVRLEQGHVTASVDDDGRRVLRVQARGGDAEAESRGGSFGVVTDGDGQLAVAATTGRVKVTANGGSVDVDAGQTTTVRKGEAPTPATTVPGSLFLKLGALAATQTNQTSTTVTGTTGPGVLVRVGEQVATSDAKGRFSLKVPLRDGTNDLAVEVADASGRRSDQRLPSVRVDRQKPTIDARVKWGTPQPPATP